MHKANDLWLTDHKAKYPEFFNNCRVLEMGSYNYNGSARQCFYNCDYTGVDRQPGADVDVVCNLTKTSFKLKFDLIFSLNTLCYDLDWKKSLTHNMQFLKKSGLCFISIETEGDYPRQYPDWASIDPNEFIKECKKSGLKITDKFYEAERYPFETIGNRRKGTLNIVAAKI
jgi:hypothetical protein